MVSMICVLLLAWLAPVAWVTHAAIRTRRRYSQKITATWLARTVGTALRWPLGIIDAARGK